MVGAIEVGHVDAIVVVNDEWADGIGLVAAAGLAAAETYGQAVAPLDGIVVSLVDQPRISPEAVAK